MAMSGTVASLPCILNPLARLWCFARLCEVAERGRQLDADERAAVLLGRESRRARPSISELHPAADAPAEVVGCSAHSQQPTHRHTMKCVLAVLFDEDVSGAGNVAGRDHGSTEK